MHLAQSLIDVTLQHKQRFQRNLKWYPFNIFNYNHPIMDIIIQKLKNYMLQFPVGVSFITFLPGTVKYET